MTSEIQIFRKNRFQEINAASERQFNNVIAAVEKVLEDHRLQIEDLYSSVRICPSGSLRFGPKVHDEVLNSFKKFNFSVIKWSTRSSIDQKRNRLVLSDLGIIHFW